MVFPRRYFYGAIGSGNAGYEFPDPPAVGPVLAPMASLASIAAASPVFRVRCGLAADDPWGSQKLLEGTHDGTKRIFYPSVDWDAFDVFPSLVLQQGYEFEFKVKAGGAQNYLLPDGQVHLTLLDEDRHPGTLGDDGIYQQTQADLEASTRDFWGYVGQFLADLSSQFGKNAAVNGDAIQCHWPPEICPVQEGLARPNGKRYWTASYFVHWKA
jgi:hypothetical protein